MSRDPTQTFAQLVAPLRPHHLEDAGFYRAFLQLLMLFFAVSIVRIIASARAIPFARVAARWRWSMLLVVTVAAAALPYRFVWKNVYERIHIDERSLLRDGEADGELLAFCPDVRPPRNRVLRQRRPDAESSGRIRKHIYPHGGSALTKGHSYEDDSSVSARASVCRLANRCSRRE